VRTKAHRLALLATVVATAAAVVASNAPATTRSTPAGAGVVVVETRLGGSGEAAGTGMVLTSSGEILTNNHVIRGATAIRVTVPATSRSYPAKVVGYDVSDDVAVLQLAGASSLETVAVGNSSTLKPGRRVTAVGNAGGTGRLRTTTGTVTGVGRTITVSDESGVTARLTGLVETNAGLEPGDSGGPLLDAARKVVGMNTAASVGFDFRRVSSSDGYAVPINRAVAIARLIEAGKASATIHVGATAYLGVEVAPGYGTLGALVAGVVPGGPADTAGLAPGDTILSVAGRTISSPEALGALVRTKKPGATVAVTYLDEAGAGHTVRVRLGSGPPQ
jgi:S1-C subfamily serine protease